MRASQRGREPKTSLHLLRFQIPSPGSTLIKNYLCHCIGCHYQFLAVSLVSVGKSPREEVAEACCQPCSVLPTEQVPGFNREGRVRVREPVPGEKARSTWPRAEAPSLGGADAVRLGARPAALPP